MIRPIILAAGAGTRLGMPKIGCRLEAAADAPTFLEAVLAACAPCGAPVVVTPPHWAPRGVRLPAAGGVTFVPNPQPDRGQLSSLQVGLAAIAGDPTWDGVLVFPVDHPLVTATEVEALVRAFAAHPGTLVFMPSHAGRRGHPMLLRKPVALELQALAPTQTARDVIQRHTSTIFYTLTDNPWATRDIDTQEDLRAARAAWQTRRAASNESR